MNKHEEAKLIVDGYVSAPTEAMSLNKNELQIYLLEKENAKLREQLRRCFAGETTSVRNEIISMALKKETERVLALPQEDIREYLSRKFDG